jgi:hypothetical protein
MSKMNVVVLGDDRTIDSIVEEYNDLCAKMRDMTKLRSHLSGSIKDYLSENNITDFISGKYKVILNNVTRRTLSKELLIEMGIDDETLELCTKETNYDQLVVK